MARDAPSPTRAPDAPPSLPPLPPDIDLDRGVIYYARLDDGVGSFNPRDEASPP